MRSTLTLFALAAGLSLQAQNVSITQIQSTTDPSGDSPYNGQTVQTTGVVTASAEDGNLGYVFIQEEGVTEWGAIQLFGHPNLGDLKIGDRIGVQGTVQESFGFTVLNQIAGIEVVDSNVAISPLVLNPNFFTNAPFSEIEKYESMYVQLQIGQDSVYVVDPNVIFGWSGIAATFCPVIILSLFWKGYSEKGAIASMITGFLSVMFFKFVVTDMEGIGPYFKELDVLAPSFATAMIGGYIVSKLFPPQKTLETD